MNAEMLDTLALENGKRLFELLQSHTEFGIIEVTHNIVGNVKLAGIVTAAESIGQGPHLLQKFNVGDVVEIDDGTCIQCGAVFCAAGFVGAEHNVMSVNAAFLR